MEAAGLAVGGVALTSVFAECVTMFEYIDAGRNCGKEYQRAALQVALLGRRLTVWEESYRQSQPPAGPADANFVGFALNGIKDCLKDVCSTSDRYEERPSELLSGDEAAVTDRIKSLTINGKVKTSLGAKIAWALYDKSKLDQVTRTITSYIESLERLSDPLVTPFRLRMATKQARVLLEASGYGVRLDVKSILEENAATVDGDLLNAVKVVTSDYQNIKVGHDGQVLNGHHIAEGYTGSLGNFGNSQYRDISGGDRAQIFNGNNYGGPLFFNRRSEPRREPRREQRNEQRPGQRPEQESQLDRRTR